MHFDITNFERKRIKNLFRECCKRRKRLSTHTRKNLLNTSI